MKRIEKNEVLSNVERTRGRCVKENKSGTEDKCHKFSPLCENQSVTPEKWSRIVATRGWERGRLVNTGTMTSAGCAIEE